MKITFVVNNISFGGAEKMATFVANSLSEKGHIISILSLNGNVQTLQKLNPRLKVYYCHDKRNSLIMQYYAWVRFVVKTSLSDKPDVFVSFLGVPNLVSVLSSKILNRPSILSERGDPTRSYDLKKISTKLIVRILNTSTGAVFQTPEASNFYSRDLKSRSCVIPNPIFIDGIIQPRNYCDMPHTIVYLGRLDNYQKRLDILLEAFKLFHQSHNDYKLIIYGRGPAQQFIETFIHDNNLKESIFLKGVSTSSQKDMSKEGIFVLTSDFEGISNSLLEAMAIGMPVITTDHTPGGGRLLVENRKNGLLVPCGDANAICSALSEFADNIKLCKDCGIEAQKVLIRFEPSKIISRWEEYIVKVAKSSK